MASARLLRRINGIRFFDTDPDIICLQETKANPDQIPEEVRNPKGFIHILTTRKRKKAILVWLFTQK